MRIRLTLVAGVWSVYFDERPLVPDPSVDLSIEFGVECKFSEDTTVEDMQHVLDMIEG